MGQPNYEKFIIIINVTSLGKFEVELLRNNAPKTIQKLIAALPIKGRGIKQGSRFVIPTKFATSQERPKSEFKTGEVSVDASSGNITIHLGTTKTPRPENFLGTIASTIETKNMPISSSVQITLKD